MIPILFDKLATSFQSYGIGPLSDAVSCVVAEERNGGFELEMEYPTSGIHFNDIKESAIILAKPNEIQDPQAFRIYAISAPISEIITIRAEHISYQLNYIPIGPITGVSCAEVMSKIKTESLISNPFNFYTDKNVNTVFTTGEPRSVRSLLGGQEGSILQQYQGEYLWDNYNVSLLVHRGEDRGVILHYGKNITDFEDESDLSNTVTGVLPYWKGENNLMVGDIIQTSVGELPFKRIEVVDISSEIELEEEQTIPTKVAVNAAGQKVLDAKSYVGIPSTNIKVSFVALWQTEEYKDIAPLEQVGLCDTVTVVYEKLGISGKLKVCKTIYNVLLDRYNEIELGDSAYSISSVVASQAELISDTISRIEKTDDRITLEVIRAKGAEGSLDSRITIESGRITSEVTRAQNAESTIRSTITQLPHTISMRVSGTAGQGTSAGITISLLDGNGNLVDSADGNITLSGNVVFKSNLYDGTTTISGSNITTGTINASLIKTGTLDASRITVTNLIADHVKSYGTDSLKSVTFNTYTEITAGKIRLNTGSGYSAYGINMIAVRVDYGGNTGIKDNNLLLRSPTQVLVSGTLTPDSPFAKLVINNKEYVPRFVVDGDCMLEGGNIFIESSLDSGYHMGIWRSAVSYSYDSNFWGIEFPDTPDQYLFYRDGSGNQYVRYPGLRFDNLTPRLNRGLIFAPKNNVSGIPINQIDFGHFEVSGDNTGHGTYWYGWRSFTTEFPAVPIVIASVQCWDEGDAGDINAFGYTVYVHSVSTTGFHYKLCNNDNAYDSRSRYLRVNWIAISSDARDGSYDI